MSHSGTGWDAPAHQALNRVHARHDGADEAHDLLKRAIAAQAHPGMVEEVDTRAITMALLVTGDIDGLPRRKIAQEQPQEEEPEPEPEPEQPPPIWTPPWQAKAAAVDQMRALRAEGLSYSQVAERVGCSATTAYRRSKESR